MQLSLHGITSCLGPGGLQDREMPLHSQQQRHAQEHGRKARVVSDQPGGTSRKEPWRDIRQLAGAKSCCSTGSAMWTTHGSKMMKN